MIGLRNGALLAATAGVALVMLTLATATRSGVGAHADTLQSCVSCGERTEPRLDVIPARHARVQAIEAVTTTVDPRAAPAFGAEITLLAVDEEGHPLPGSVLHVLELDQDGWGHEERITPFDLDPLNEVLRRGTKLTCDELGSVKVARPQRTIAVLATTDELGTLECLEPGSCSPWFVYLRPHHVLEVRVRDHQGVPAVDLGLEVHESDGDRLWHGFTDANGRALVDSLAFALHWPDRVVVVTAAIPSDPPIERWVPNDLSVPGGIDLVIPNGSTTTLRVVDARGRVLDVGGELEVVLPEDRPRASCETKRIHIPLRAGVAVLRGLPRTREPFFVYGRGISACLAPRPDGSWPATIDIPVEEEQELVRFALLGPDGRPHAQRLITWRHWMPASGDVQNFYIAEGRILVDERGELSCCVDLAARSGAEYEGRLNLFEFVDAGARPPLHAVVPIDSMRASRPDVPFSVPLQPVPLALAGRVIDEFGTPVVGARIEVEPQTDAGDRSQDLRTFAEAFTDADGRFEIFALPTSAPITADVLVNEDQMAGEDPPRAFEFGTRDVELRAPSGATIEGRLLVDAEHLDRNFEIGAFREDEDHGVLDIWLEGSELRWRLRRLEPDTYELRVFVDGCVDPVHSVENVLVPKAALVLDPRCLPLDLRGRVPPITDEGDAGSPTLRIADARGMPIEHGIVRYRLEQDWQSWQAWGGGEVRSYSRSERIAVWSPGCFVREGPAPDRDTTWTLKPVRPVELELPVPQDLRSPAIEYSIKASFDAYGAEGQGFGWMFSDFKIHATLEPSSRTLVELPLEGKWSIRLVAGWNTSEGPSGCELQTFTIRFQDETAPTAFVLEPDATAWCEKLRKAEAPLPAQRD